MTVQRRLCAVAATALALLAAPATAQAPPDILDEFETPPPAAPNPVLGQARGEYPEMHRPGPPLGQIQNAWNYAEPAPGQTQPGVLRVAWRPDRVIQVRTRDFMFTLVHLPPWERIVQYYLGDETTFGLVFHKDRPNVIQLRQKQPGADSNLALITESGRVVSFYIRSEGWNSHDVSDLAVFVETPRPSGSHRNGAGATPILPPRVPPAAAYRAPPVGKASGAGGDGHPDFLRRIPFDVADLRWTDYAIEVTDERDAAIAPERVFHDGLFTYFDWGERADVMERPVVHLVIDGVDSPVNTRTIGEDGQILAAEAVGDFTLRAGPRVVCVHYRPRGKVAPRP